MSNVLERTRRRQAEVTSDRLYKALRAEQLKTRSLEIQLKALQQKVEETLQPAAVN